MFGAWRLKCEKVDGALFDIKTIFGCNVATGKIRGTYPEHTNHGNAMGYLFAIRVGGCHFEEMRKRIRVRREEIGMKGNRSTGKSMLVVWRLRKTDRVQTFSHLCVLLKAYDYIVRSQVANRKPQDLKTHVRKERGC